MKIVNFTISVRRQHLSLCPRRLSFWGLPPEWPIEKFDRPQNSCTLTSEGKSYAWRLGSFFDQVLLFPKMSFLSLYFCFMKGNVEG